MANYPTSLDDFTNPSAGNTLDSPSHSLQHSDINDAVEALEAKVGIGASPAGSATAGQVLTAQGGGTALWTTPDAGGLVHIETRTVTASASEIFNSVFSATYENYLVVLEVTNTGNVANRIRLRKSGTDASTNYERLSLVGNSTNAQSAQTTDPDVTFGGAVKKIASINIFRPFVNQSTTLLSSTYSLVGNVGFLGVNHTTVDTYDGFNLFPVSGSITGSVKIYGYKD